MAFVDWLKYFFGSFFLHKYASESEERGFGGPLLGLLLAMAMIFAGLFGGSVAAFPSYYENSEEYTQFLYNAFAQSGEDRLNIKIENGVARAGKFGGEYGAGLVANTFTSEADRDKYSVNGYQLVIDTRDSKTNYNDFKCEYKKGDVTLTHDEYLTLKDEEKKNYTVYMEYTADALVLDAEKVKGYTDWLLGCGNAEAKKECEALLTGGVAPQSNYNAVYELYFKYCYPELAGAETFGKAPTMRTYYVNTYMQTGEDGKLACDKYLIVLSDIAFSYFYSGDGIFRGVSGFLSSFGDISVTQSAGAEAAKSEVDGFFIEFNKASAGMLSVNYLINMIMVLLYTVIAWAVIGAIGWALGAASKCPPLKNFTVNLKSSGSFMLVSGLLAFAFTFGMSFVLSGAGTYFWGLVFFIGVLGLRSLAHMAITLARYKKESAAPTCEEPAESEEGQG